MTKFAVYMDEGAKSATVIHMKKENYTMGEIYKLIKKIILANEPNADDEFFWLDKFFDPQF